MISYIVLVNLKGKCYSVGPTSEAAISASHSEIASRLDASMKLGDFFFIFTDMHMVEVRSSEYFGGQHNNQATSRMISNGSLHIPSKALF